MMLATLLILVNISVTMAAQSDLTHMGKTCGHWWECESEELICFRGICSIDEIVGSFCNRTNRCTPGYHCRRNRSGPPGGNCIRGCRVDFHCPERHVCIDQDCVFDQGRSLMCQTYLDCPRAHWCKTIVSKLSGICIEGCLEDTHCGASMLCEAEKCVPKPKDLSCRSHEDCDQDSHCSFEYDDSHTEGQCTPGCTKDEHCFRHTNALCIKTACVVRECLKDEDCPDTHRCGNADSKGRSDKVCVSKIKRCRSDLDCHIEQFCSSKLKQCEMRRRCEKDNQCLLPHEFCFTQIGFCVRKDQREGIGKRFANATTTATGTTAMTMTAMTVTTMTTTSTAIVPTRKAKPASKYRVLRVCNIFFCSSFKVRI